MKFRFIRTLVLFSLSWLLLLPAQAASVTYTFDPSHTFVLWQINHLGFSHPTGKWPAEGTIDFDAAKPQDSKVNVTIKVGDVLTGVPKLDEHLRTKDFFDTLQFPTATFVSDKVVMTGKDSAKVQGTLTMHGVSKEIEVPFELSGKVKGMKGETRIGAEGATTLKRQDYGISWSKMMEGGGVVVGDDVKVTFSVEGIQKP